MFFIDKNIYNDENTNIEVHHYIGLISWYLIFIVIIPFLIIHSKSFNELKYYLPIIDLIANIFSVSGKKNKQVFKDVYSLSPNNIVSFISTNFINLLALTGVAWNGVDVAIKRNSMLDGVLVMVWVHAQFYHQFASHNKSANSWERLCGYKFFPMFENVTHWMPLPEPPEDKP